MKYPKQLPRGGGLIAVAGCRQSAQRRIFLLGVCAALMMTSAIAQQTVSLTANPTRLTIPVNNASSASSTVTVTIAGGTDPVNLAVTGLPAGASASLSQSAFTASGSSTLTVTFNNVAQGEYDVAVEATGAASYRLPLPLKAAYVWSGAGTTTNITEAANWVGGVAPGAADSLVFTDAGANAAATVPTVRVPASVEVGSLLFKHGSTLWHNLDFASGATLSVTGPGGFLNLRDELPAGSRSHISASGAGTLVVSNAAATFATLVDAENSANNLDLDALDKLVIDVNKIAFADYRVYPNVTTNGNNTNPRRWVPHVWLAKTNLIRATHTDANNWTDPGEREYGLVIARNRPARGSGTDFRFYFGLANELYLDSMLICGSGSQADAGANNSRVQFNNSLTGSKSLTLRGINGGRMTNLTLAEAAVPDGTVSQGTKVIVDLSLGSVDALVDRLYLSRDATNSNGGNVESRLILNAGTFDANSAILGYQSGPGAGTGVGYCRGVVEANGTSVFRVNGTLELGYTAIAAGSAFQAELGYGQLSINGGTVIVSNITVGGVTKISVENNITMNNGGTLVVSNGVGAADGPVNVLTMNNSRITLHVDGANSTPYVFVKTLTTGGSSNVIELASVTGVASYPATIALISYTGSAAPNYSLQLPAGLYGYVVNNTANSTVDAVITTTPPADLVWNGVPNGNWDTATANWQGGLTFTDGDSARFDDSAAGTTSVTVVGSVTPGPAGVIVSNVSKAYSISGGSILGTASMIKRGAQSLTIDASSQVPLNIEEGSVSGSGTLGFTTVSPGASLNYSGIINGLATAGTTVNSGTVNIGLSVSDGTFLNSSTVNGTVTLSGGTTTNPGTINATGTSTIATNAMLVHNGQFNNATARLSVGGALTGSGKVSDLTGDPAGNNGRVEINAGAVFTPGGSNQIGSFVIEGRFDLNAGTPDGRMIIDVDLNNPLKNDVVFVDKWSNLRGALTMNNIGSVPFALGQSFVIVSNNFNLPNTPETAFDLQNKITPKVPGVGLQWDLSNLRTNGIIAIMAAPDTSPMLTNIVVGGTNLNLSWPTTHLGWQLKAQTNSLNVGLTTNWYPVAGTENTNQYSAPIDPANPTVFYLLSNQ